MRYTLPLVASLGLLVATPMAAQTPYSGHCPAGNVGDLVPDEDRIAHDACVKGIDLFRYVAPQLGGVVAGGNAILGSGGTLGGFGHVTFGIRLHALAGELPRADRVSFSTGGAEPTDFQAKRQAILLPVADVALGVFAGLPLGITNVGGVDLLVSASYLPEFDGGNVRVRVPGGSLKLGYGLRLGIIQESLLLPGVAVSVLRRDLPRVNVSARTSEGDSVAVTGLEVNTTSWRLTAGKSFMAFAVAVGTGRDRYSYEGDMIADIEPSLGDRVLRQVSDVPGAVLDGVSLRRLTRTSYFADVSINMPFFRLVGEIGQVSGGNVPTFNTFSGDPADKARLYGSIGARIGW